MTQFIYKLQVVITPHMGRCGIGQSFYPLTKCKLMDKLGSDIFKQILRGDHVDSFSNVLFSSQLKILWMIQNFGV